MSKAVLAVCTSATKGVQKSPVDAVTAVVDHGLEGDAHAGPWHRQVSLLANESAERIRAAGVAIEPGDFGENLLTEGSELVSLPVGTRLTVGEALLEVTQIGKECHTRCAIFDAAGTCVMPSEGIFCRVLEGGRIAAGDPIEEVR